MKVVATKLREIMRADPLREWSQQVGSVRFHTYGRPRRSRGRNGRLVGILTDGYIGKKVVAKRLDPALTLVSDIMNRDPMRISDESRCSERDSRDAWCQEHVVQDFAGKPIGVVCGCDLLQLDSARPSRRKHETEHNP